MSFLRDLKFNATTGDLDLTGGDIGWVDDLQAIAQQVAFRLQFFQGECFLDTTQGIPYFTQIFAKNAPAALVKSVFYNAIANSPGIVRVLSLDLTLSGTKLTVTWQAQTVLGVPISQTNNLVFSQNSNPQTAQANR